MKNYCYKCGKNIEDCDGKGHTWTSQEIDNIQCPQCKEVLKECECEKKFKPWEQTK